MQLAMYMFNTHVHHLTWYMNEADKNELKVQRNGDTNLGFHRDIKHIEY